MTKTGRLFRSWVRQYKRVIKDIGATETDPYKAALAYTFNPKQGKTYRQVRQFMRKRELKARRKCSMYDSTDSG